MNTTRPDSIGGTNVPIAWPNMWLSGRRFRNRMGRNGRVYFLYFAISRSIGTMFARMFLCVRTTPLGSAVAPEVKMISAVVVGSRFAARGARRVSGSLVASGFDLNSSGRFQIGRAFPSAVASTVSPTRIAFASTMPATFCRKSGDVR